MKTLKKVLAGVLSLAVIAGAAFAFTGCSKSKIAGKTYDFSGMEALFNLNEGEQLPEPFLSTATYTIVTKVTKDDKGKVTAFETVTLSAKEFYVFEEVAEGDYEVYKALTADQKTAKETEFDEKVAEAKADVEAAAKIVESKTLARLDKDGNVEVETSEKNLISGIGSREIQSLTYEEEDGVITVFACTDYANKENDGADYQNEVVMFVFHVMEDGRLELREYDPAYEMGGLQAVELNMLLYTSYFFNEVK